MQAIRPALSLNLCTVHPLGMDLSAVTGEALARVISLSFIFLRGWGEVLFPASETRMKNES